MKRGIICLLFLLFLFFLSGVYASSIGISPMYYKEFFESGMKGTYTFFASCPGVDDKIQLYARGDLAEYVNFSRKNINGSGYFDVRINLPDKIDKPGNHPIYIGAVDARDFAGDGIGSRAGIEARIDIVVPYPGVYVESEFEIFDVNEGENGNYKIILRSLGTKDVIVNSTIDLFEETSLEKISTIQVGVTELIFKNEVVLTDKIDMKNLKPGKYFAIATFEYNDKADKIKKDFRVGEFLVEIVDYSYMFERGRINPFIIEVESKWNTGVDEIYAEVTVVDEGIMVGQFKTSFINLNSWEKKNITGYFDTSKLESKRYIASINIFYSGEVKNKLVAIYVRDPPLKETLFYILIGIVLLIALATIVYLILKVR
jgi:hypothetical protein